MKNLIIPNPTKYEITYIDAKGEETQRKIVIINQDATSVTGYCYHAHGIRSFKKDNIQTITSVE